MSLVVLGCTVGVALLTRFASASGVGDGVAEQAVSKVSASNSGKINLYTGLSFGGMVALHLQKLLAPQKTILISTVKTSSEFPWYYRTFRFFPVHLVLPGKSFFWLSWLAEPFTYGNLRKEVRKIRREFLHKANPKLVKWSIQSAVNWKNDKLPENFIHIHGARDAMFPRRFVNATHIIENANHMMIVENAREVSKIIRNFVG